MPAKDKLIAPDDRGELGEYLWTLRQACGLSLRDVEEASGVSNAYLSQLESGKLKDTKPSPQILHSLHEAYTVRTPKNTPVQSSYEQMMQLAGHISKPAAPSGKRKGRLPTFAREDLSAEEEQELLRYLAFLRMRKRGT